MYIKEGVYTENVTIGKRLWNVTMYGDGMNKTIITNNLNVVDRTPTFISGTLSKNLNHHIFHFVCFIYLEQCDNEFIYVIGDIVQLQLQKVEGS